MATASQSADIGHSLRRTQGMIRDAIQQTKDVDHHLQGSTEQLQEILGVHNLIGASTSKGKGLISALRQKAFWDRHLYKLVFTLYLLVVVYIASRHFGNLFYRIYDWMCWTLSFFLFWLPGFDTVCRGYTNKATISPAPLDFDTHDAWIEDATDLLDKPEL